MAKNEAEEMIEIEIDEPEKQACLEEGYVRCWLFELHNLAHAAAPQLYLFRALLYFQC